jgi:hypothetical protein
MMLLERFFDVVFGCIREKKICRGREKWRAVVICSIADSSAFKIPQFEAEYFSVYLSLLFGTLVSTGLFVFLLMLLSCFIQG